MIVLYWFVALLVLVTVLMLFEHWFVALVLLRALVYGVFVSFHWFAAVL